MERQEDFTSFVEPKRASRVRQRSRMIQKYVRLLKFHRYLDETDDELEKRARWMHNHFTDCSCPMCGNPRRHYEERTVQERKHFESMRNQLKQLGLNSTNRTRYKAQ